MATETPPANRPGVRQSETPGEGGARPEGSKLLNKKNRKWVIIGGAALGGYLLLQHGNNQAQSQQGTPQSQLTDPYGYGGFGNATPSGGEPINIKIGSGGSGSTTTQKPPPPGTPLPPVAIPPGHGKPPKRKPPVAISGGSGGTRNPRGGKNRPPLSKAAHRGSSPKVGKSGNPNNSASKTRTGAKKSSPALVESVQGLGDGSVILGREFPGATSHRISGPGRNGGRVVSVSYGGRTDRHLVLPDGSWVDQVPGMNPPGRGVPLTADRSVAR